MAYDPNKLIPNSPEPEPDRWASDLIQPTEPTVKTNVVQRSPTAQLQELSNGRWIPNATPQLDKAAGTAPSYWSDPRRIGRYYHAIQALPDDSFIPEWIDRQGIESAFNYLKETREGSWETWDNVTDDDPLNIIIKDMPVPPPNFMPLWEQELLRKRSEQNKLYKGDQLTGYQPDPTVRDTEAIGIGQDVWEQLPAWKKAANQIMPVISTAMPGLGGAIIGGTIGGPVGAILGAGGMIGGAKYAEKNPDSIVAKLFLALNWPAEQVEKVAGLEAQIIYSLVDPDKYGEVKDLFGSWENFVATYKAGALFYESLAAGQQIVDDRNVREEARVFGGTLNEYMSTWIDSPGEVEPNRVIVGHDITSTEDIITEVPDQKLANAWVMQEARSRILKGESPKEVYFSLAQNFGFLGSTKELVGNVLLDPLDLIGPVGNVAMGKVGKVTGNTAMLDAFGFDNAGKSILENTQAYKTMVRTMPAEQAAQLSSFGQWVAGITKEGMPKELVTKPGKNPFNYLFGLTPTSRANYTLSTMVDGLNNLIAHEWDIPTIEALIDRVASLSPQDAIKAAETPTMKLNVGGVETTVPVPKYYMSAEAQVMPAAIKDSLPAVKEKFDAYKVAEPQRQIINKIAEYMGYEKPEQLIRKLHNAKAKEADQIFTQFVFRLQAAAKAGDTSAARILDTLGKADEFKTLSGSKLKKMADEFVGTNGIAFNEAILKYQILDTLERQISKWAVDWFGVKPDKLLFRMGNVIKRAQGVLLLGLNPAYFFNNTIDNLVKMSWDGLIRMGNILDKKAILADLGYTPTRWMQAAGAYDVGGIESGTLKMMGVDADKVIGEDIRAATRAKDAIQGVDDFFKKGDKFQVMQQASQLNERWSSSTAMARGIEEYLNRAFQPGKGFDKVPDDLKLMLEAIEPGLSKKFEKAIAGRWSKKKIENYVFGKMGRKTSIKDVLDPDAADMLDHLGLTKEFDRRLATAKTDDDIFNVFKDMTKTIQDNITQQIIRNMKKITNDALMKTSVEGLQGVLDMMDNLEQMNADFWLLHMDNMHNVADEAAKRKGAYRAATWETGRTQASRNWNNQNNIYGSKTLGIFEGLGMDNASPEYLNVGKLIIGKNNNWNDFYKLTDELYSAFADSVNDVTDAERMTKWNDLNVQLNQAYLDAILSEDAIINSLNDMFIVQYAKQFENKGQLAILEARNWRSSIMTERRKMMQAQLLWRNGTIPEDALKWGDLLPQATKDAITKLNQGKPIHTFNRATRDKISPKFWNVIYRQFVRDMSMASANNAPGMVKSANLPKDLQADLPEIPKPEVEAKPKRPAAVEKHETDVWKVISEKKPELAGIDENGMIVPEGKLNVIKYVLKWSPEARAKMRLNADKKLHFTDIMPSDIEQAIGLEADWMKRQMELPLDDPKRIVDESGNIVKAKPEPEKVDDPFKAERERSRRTTEEQAAAIAEQQPEQVTAEPVISEQERIQKYVDEQNAKRQESIDNQLAELQQQIDENNRLYEIETDQAKREELRTEAARLDKQRKKITQTFEEMAGESTTQPKQYLGIPETSKVADIQDEFIRSSVTLSLQQMLDDVGLTVEVLPDNTRVVEAGGLGWYKDWYYGQKRSGKDSGTWNASINRRTRSALEHLIKGTDSKSDDILAYQQQIFNDAFRMAGESDIYTAWKSGDYDNAIRLYDQVADTMDNAAILDLLHGDEGLLDDISTAWIKSLEENDLLNISDEWSVPGGEIEPAPRFTPEQQALIDARKQYKDVLDTYDMLRSNADEMQRNLPPMKVGREATHRALFDYLNETARGQEYDSVIAVWEGLSKNYARNNPGKTPEDWYETWAFNYGGDEIDIVGLSQLYQEAVASPNKIHVPDNIKNFARMLLRSDDKQILFELQWADSIDQKKQLLTALHQQDPVRAKNIFDQAMQNKEKYLWQEGMSPEQRQANLNKFMEGSKVVDENGKPKWLYHGANRIDRIAKAEKFDKTKATSGPMAFFTDDPEIATGYSTNKADNSLYYESTPGDYYKKVFKVTDNGKEYSLIESYNKLPAAKRREIADKLKDVTAYDPITGDELEFPTYIKGSGGPGGLGHWNYILRQEAKNNPIDAAINIWLESGNLYNNEADFVKVLRQAGWDKGIIELVETRPGIIPVVANIKNPLDTMNIPNELKAALQERATIEEPKFVREPGGADFWDKNTISPLEWIDYFNKNMETGDTTVWTRIPDWATDTIKSYGYDGIKDYGGKYSSNKHTVWIPFDETQVKSIFNQGTFNPDDPRMLHQQKRGFTHWTDDGVAIVHALKSGDVSTLVHETIHVYTRQMGAEHSKVVTDWLRKDHKLELADEWYLDPIANREASELLAKGFEKYLAEGKAPTPKLQQVFENFKRWMVDIYKSITGSDIDITLSDDVRKVFDEWVSGEKVAEAEQAGGTSLLDGQKEWWQLTKEEIKPIADEINSVLNDKKYNNDNLHIGRLQRKLETEQKELKKLKDFQAENDFTKSDKKLVNKIKKQLEIVKDTEIKLQEARDKFYKIGRELADTMLEKFPDYVTPLDEYPYFVGNKNWSTALLKDGHLDAVRKAIREGKQVPPEVLADYPELARLQPEPQSNIFTPKAQTNLFGEDMPAWGLKPEQAEAQTFKPQDESLQPKMFDTREYLPEIKAKQGGDVKPIEGGLFQDAPSAPKENYAQGAPFGTADQLIEAPMDEMLYEGFLKNIQPTLDKAMNDLMSSKVAEQGSIASRLPEEAQPLLRKYLGKVYSDLSSTNMGAIKYAEGRRKFSLLDYSARTGFDSVAGMFMPYQFWYTRSAINWLIRIAADPKILADYLRLQNFAQDAEDREGFPTRLKGKVGIPAPFLPDWMGDTIYIDPMRKIFNFQDMARPFTQLAEENNLVNQKTMSAIQRMLEEDQITEEQAQEAIESRSGKIWEDAKIQAKAEADTELNNPLDFAFALSSPSLPLSLAREYFGIAGGDKSRISQLPITRTIQSVTSMMGIGKNPRGVNVEEPFRKGFGLPEIDRFEAYRIDRELSNMVADGLIDKDTAIMSMINRTGPDFEDAQRRVATQMNIKMFLSSVGVDFFPEGEEEMRAIQSEYYKAMEARYEQGDEQAFTKFWDEFPEYEARQAAVNDDPEEMMRHFLRSRIWQAWNEKNGYEKGQVAKAFGDVFEDSFLNKETRNYDDISTETYAAWAKTLGATMPDKLEGTPEIANASIPDEINNQLNQYLSERNSNFPGISETLEQLYALPEAQQQAFRNSHPMIEDYQSWRNKFITQNPSVVSYLTGESSELYGLPEPVQLAVYNYRQEVNDNFPNIYDTQSAYFNIANTNAKKNYLKQHPELPAYWDFRREYSAAYPQAAPYILSDESLAKSILGEDRYINSTVQEVDRTQFDDALLRLLASYYYGGRPLTSGARAELTRLWDNAGKPAGTMENWLNAYVWPTIKK